jgi:hypothetical protein
VPGIPAKVLPLTAAGTGTFRDSSAGGGVAFRICFGPAGAEAEHGREDRTQDCDGDGPPRPAWRPVGVLHSFPLEKRNGVEIRVFNVLPVQVLPRARQSHNTPSLVRQLLLGIYVDSES